MHTSPGLQCTTRLLRVWAIAASLCCRSGFGAAPAPNALPLTGAGQSEGTNAFPGFQIEQGFRMEMVAAEPAIAAPIAMAFDENGRLFVAELSGPVQQPGAQTQPGRVRMLEDTNGDGVFETSSVYADNLSEPSALTCYDGGLFVATIPDLLYIKHAGTNQGAGERAVISSSFGSTNRAAGPGWLNNLHWGLDNRIHGVTGPVAGEWPAAGATGGPREPMAGAQIVLELRTHTISVVASPAYSGSSFDNWGTEFLTQPSHPLLTYMYNPRYTARNPYFIAPREILDVASPATRVFSLVPVAAGGATPGSAPVQPSSPFGGTTAPAWLTNACGCVIYRGDAFPAAYAGNAFVADPQAHLVHRSVLRDNGLEPVANRPAEERSSEFLVSVDPSFQPVQVANGPDGALYVLDRQDGSYRGRIYRIVPLGFKRPKTPQLSKANTSELVALLSQANGWQRDTAARLLYERRDPVATAPLARTLAGSPNPLGRLHALYVLDGLGTLRPELLARALSDRDGRVREHAVRLAETRLAVAAPNDPAWNQLVAMTADPALRVRYQLAFTLGQGTPPGKALALAAIVSRDPGNTWMQAAVLSSASDVASGLFLMLGQNLRFRNDPAGWAFLRRLANMIGVAGQPTEAGQVVDFINQTALGQEGATALLASLGEGLYCAGSPYFNSDPRGRVQRLFVSAFAIAANPYAADPLRTDALRAVSVGPDMFVNARSWLLDVFGNRQAPAVQAAAMALLGRFDDPQIAPTLIQRLRFYTPAVRRDIVAALLARPDRVADVMAALQDGRISPEDVGPLQRNYLRTFPAAATSDLGVRLLGPVPVERTNALQQFLPALGLKGVSDRGQAIFEARCATCHRLLGDGEGFGPELVQARIAGKRDILASIIEPDAAMAPNGPAQVVETAGGEVLIGLLLNQHPTTIGLGQANGARLVLPLANVRYMHAQSWSFMPAGLEEGLSPQDMADLLEYTMTIQR